MQGLLPAANTLHVGVGELISSVSFDTYQRKLFLSDHSKLFDGITLRSEGRASDLKLQSAEQVAAHTTQEHLFSTCLYISLFSVLDLPLSLTFCLLVSLSLSCSHSIQHGKLQKDFFFTPPLALLFQTHSQPNLLVTAKPLLSHRLSRRHRFLVQLLPVQMSPPMMFLIHTLPPSLQDPASSVHPCFLGSFLVDEPRLGHSAYTPAVSCLWTNRALICSEVCRVCAVPDEYIMLIFPSGQ